jgi:MSHA biogenesis protein MshO
MTNRPRHPRPAMPPRARAAGFTLVEAVLVIVIIGVLAGVVAVFIRAPILGYRDSVDRAEITDQADLALRRMTRDIRLALPNSVRVSGDGRALEFLQTRSGARYLSAEDGVATALTLNFETAQASFTAIAPLSTFGQVRVGDYVVVYNLGPGFEPADAYNLNEAAKEKNIASITARADKSVVLPGQGAADATRGVEITLANNPFAGQSTPMSSPMQRFQVVSGPVSFYCERRDDGTFDLWRHWGYAIGATQPLPAIPASPTSAATASTFPAGGTRALAASRLTRCTGIFNYSTAAAQRTGLVGIDLALRGRNEATQAIRLLHQVHVDNTP